MKAVKVSAHARRKPRRKKKSRPTLGRVPSPKLSLPFKLK